jgi:hypothetical protein
MKKIFYLFILIVIGCKIKLTLKLKQNDNIDIANQFIDAFYSFNEDSLKLSLSYARVKTFYFVLSKWAECGNYKSIKSC